MTTPFESLSFAHGPAMRNRFMLSPLTNLQSHPDGRLGDDEYRWLTMRADGGFGFVMTCAAHVQAIGQGFPGQLGIWSDAHLEGLTRLAAGLKAAGAVCAVQLHHAGIRSPRELIGTAPVGPSADAETGARALTPDEVEALREDFIAAALRAERAGFDGVELHGAHGYALCAFLSPQYNRRDDRYGGSPENRARLLTEIIAGIRARCRPDFQLGVRLSPERFGIVTAEALELAQQLCAGGAVDYLDLSMWDVFKEPEDAAFKGQPLIAPFAGLARGGTRIGVAGRLYAAEDVRRAIDAGADFVLIGRAAILHHDFPGRVAADAGFRMATLPVTEATLRREGLGDAFIGYLRGWKDFVAD
jgi:2,4-dienoyl-CoA reductase-like NADH-dependent reductase (Old Yellow Enzyme family)